MPRLELTSVTLGAADVDELAQFWARLLSTSVTGRDVDADGTVGWAQLRTSGSRGEVTVNVEHEAHHVAPTWPARPGEQVAGVHLDLDVDDLAAATDWALECGARLANTQPQDDVRVLFDPAGHPFCLFLDG